jgi:uncharacterized protein
MIIFIEHRQKKLFESVKKFYTLHNFDIDHDIYHIVRVMRWCVILSKKEKANLSIVLPAAMLHDIGMITGKKDFHAQISSKMCRSFLKKCGYNAYEITEISETILAHSAGYKKPLFRTKEMKVLFDADKLECVYSIGLQRWFSFFIRRNFKHHDAAKEILITIKNWKKSVGNGDAPFYTKTGKKIGSKGLTYIEKIFMNLKADTKKIEKTYKELGLK